jgi:hypothetical protein
LKFFIPIPAYEMISITPWKSTLQNFDASALGMIQGLLMQSGLDAPMPAPEVSNSSGLACSGVRRVIAQAISILSPRPRCHTRRRSNQST